MDTQVLISVVVVLVVAVVLLIIFRGFIVWLLGISDVKKKLEETNAKLEEANATLKSMERIAKVIASNTK